MTWDRQTAERQEIGVFADDKFKTCNQIEFYRRQKLLQPGQSLYQAQLDTLTIDENSATFQILHQATKVPLQVCIIALEGDIFRIKINEVSPLKPRYEVADVLVRKPVTKRLSVVEEDVGTVVLAYPNDPYKLHISSQPFCVSVTLDGKPVLSANSQGLLYFEHQQSPSTEIEMSRSNNDGPQDFSQDELGQECNNHLLDSKANGPTSVGLDFSLYGFEHVYGLPEHADSHNLSDTKDDEAYRLYNLDVFGYSIHDKMGIYGSVPLLLAHKASQTCGIFWLNASETLVEVKTKEDVQKQRFMRRTDVRWMSESGIVDIFLLMGPAPQDVFKQYAQLTGTQAFPPKFSLGYHQCRWNYEDEEDVEAVDSGFDEHGIPYDVIWLDIEHTEEKRYFTWDEKRFPNPIQMQEKLREKKRKLVAISDPHIKVDPSYTLYTEAKEKGYFVKKQTGQDFEGICWPGTSSYLDFTNPAVRDWYAAQFALDKYKGSTDILFIWNDMNEPSVFMAPEKTMDKHEVHHQGWEHRDLHNLYGFYQQMSTAEGLTRRSGGQKRPFVLTRSFFAGSQRYGAVWTGDNIAEWDYLKISIPMLLSLSVTGITFCGADVGGFVGDPEPELLVRWYQAGSFQPFFRAHAMLGSKRREPWLFGADNTCLIKNAIEERYKLLPYWYLLFYRAHISAEPVMRPLWVEFPKQKEIFRVENQYLLGNALMVVPVVESGASVVHMLFPGYEELWYDFRKYKCVKGPHKRKIRVTLEEIPVYQRGGSIIPMYIRAGKSTEWMDNFPYELHVALDSKGSAVGELFIDDGDSFQYLYKNMFIHRRFTFQKNVLSSCAADRAGQYPAQSLLEKILIMGVKKSPSQVTVHMAGGDKTALAFTHDHKLCLLCLEHLSLGISADWEIHIMGAS
ncbi:neutral alpha-glucosidase C isoform X2 [Bombina bombina]|uniref:neutral alpha-glucosidase C isoform X2 n=1 Tax=Bombina bombina TaxID=8345 RepID=UPI00235A49AF|nr:neutral alpha-glucosidase C isoform X2 [Bombina bombina]